MKSPYNNHSKIPEAPTLEIFMGKKGLKTLKKIVFNEEQFEDLCSFLQDMFPSEDENMFMEPLFESQLYEINLK